MRNTVAGGEKPQANLFVESVFFTSGLLGWEKKEAGGGIGVNSEALNSEQVAASQHI